jgi:hypothetical protein
MWKVCLPVYPIGVTCTLHNNFMLTWVFNLRDVQVWAGKFDDWSHCTWTRHNIKHSVLAKSLFTLASPGNPCTEWLCWYSPQNSPTTKSSSQEQKMCWNKLRTPAPICRGCSLPLTCPLHSQPSGSPFGTNSTDKGHVYCASFSPTDLT